MKKMTTSNLRQQRGLSKFGVLMMIVLIATFLTFGLKVGPIYVDHNLITGICEELISSGEAVNMTTSEVRTRVSNSLRINNVTDFDLNNIRLRKENNEAIITIAYERRVELIANLDVVAKFDTTLQ